MTAVEVPTGIFIAIVLVSFLLGYLMGLQDRSDAPPPR